MMVDQKVLGGAIITMTAAGTSWVETVTAYGQLFAVGIAGAVGIATFIHTVNLIRKDKRERDEDKRKGSGGGSSNPGEIHED
jgi:hypothetical protein